MTYQQKLKELRTENGKNQTDIANILQTTQQYYGKYELGLRPLPIEHLKTLCLLYGVSADYILGLPKDLKYPER